MSGIEKARNPEAVTPISGTVTANQGAAGASPWPIKIDQSGTNNDVDVISSVLPTGASTSANQSTEIASLASIDAKLTNPLPVSGPLTDAQLRATPVPISGTVTANLGTIDGVATEATLLEVEEDLDQFTFSATRLLTDGSGVIQPVSGSVTVSGTVTANLGTIDGAATAANQTTANTSLASIDSKLTSPVTVTGTVTANLGTIDGVATSALQTTGNTSLASIDSKLTNPLPISGTVTANAGTGNFTVVQPTGTNLHAVIDSGAITVSGTVTANIGTTNGLALDATLTGGTQKTKIVDTGGTNVASVSAAGAVKVDGSAVTQPVSGTVTANIGTTNGLALDATLTSGSQKTQLVSSTVSTYSTTTGVVGTAATATDVFTIYGSGTKTIKVLKVYLDTTQTIAGTNIWILMKRSTANTGGTSTATVRVPHDSNNAAATATALIYSANPAALGTLVGNIAVSKVFSPPIGTFGDEYLWDFDQLNGEPITLRGTGEGLTLNFNGAATPAGEAINIRAIWTEE